MSGSNDRRWSLARATEFFSGDGKPDMYDHELVLSILVERSATAALSKTTVFV